MTTPHEFALFLARQAAERQGKPAPTAQDKLIIRLSTCGEAEEVVFNG